MTELVKENITKNNFKSKILANISKIDASELKISETNKEKKKTTQLNITKYLNGYSSIKPKTTKQEKTTLKYSNKLEKYKDHKEQLMLDFGQTDLGLKKCQTCGMIYNSSEPCDVNMHQLFHNRTSTTLKYIKSKNDKVVEHFFTLGEIIVIHQDDTILLKKLKKTVITIENEFGFSVDLESVRNSFKIYLYLLNKEVYGLCIAELINKEINVQCLNNGAKSQFIRCGINKIWVHDAHRRSHIATKLLDAMRINFLFGYALDKDDIAFFEPTDEGIKFAVSYLGDTKPLIY